MTLEINHIMNFVKIECRSDNSIRLRAPNKKYYEDCSISSRSGDAFQMSFYSEQAIYDEFVRIMGYYKFFLFTNSAYIKSFTCGNKLYVMKKVIDWLMVDYPANFGLSESCVVGEITSAICNDSESLYTGDQFVGNYLVVNVGTVWETSADITVGVAGLYDTYITETIELGEDECYLFEVADYVYKLNIRAMWANTYIQIRECVMPASAIETSDCYTITFEEYEAPEEPEEEPIERLPPCGNYGDIDGDGYVTIDDAQKALEFAVGIGTPTEDELLRGDLNQNDRIDSGDALLINRYVEGLIDTFPICEVDPCEGKICEDVCIGYDLYSQKCVDGVCVLDELIEQNSLSCDYVPPDPCEGVICEDRCIGYDLYSQKCVDGECVTDKLIEQNSLSCDYIPECVPKWVCELDIEGKNTGALIDGCGNRKYDIIKCPIGKEPTVDSLIPIAIGLGIGLLGLFKMRK